MSRYLLLIAAAVFFETAVPSTQADPFKVTTDSKGVRFEMHGTVATAHRLEYDADSEKLVLEGKGDTPVTLSRTTDGHPEELRAKRITLYVKIGKLKAEGIQFFNVKP